VQELHHPDKGPEIETGRLWEPHSEPSQTDGRQGASQSLFTESHWTEGLH